MLAHPSNWRLHPKNQQDALSGVLNEIGWIQSVIVNQRTGFVIDGHLRVALAISHREPEIPVVYVDLSDEEEALALASIDPISAMAATDKELLDSLLRDVSSADAGVMAMLSDLAEKNGLGSGPEPGDDNLDPGDDRYKEQYGVIIVATSESEQQRIYEELTEQGYTCRVVVT